MKILIYLSSLVFVPIIVGMALLLSGYNAGAFVLAFGTPAVMIALVIAGLIMLMKGKLFKSKPENNGGDGNKLSAKEREQKDINAVNSTKFYTSQVNLAEYEARNIIEGTKNAPKKGVAAVIIVVLLILIDVALAVTFAVLNIWAGAITCAALFVITITASLITAVVREKISMNNDISNAEKIVAGKVKSCVMSSTITSKSTTPTVRLHNVVYRVVVTADGEEYAAYSKQFYENGEDVTVAVMNKGNAKIVEEAELEKLNEAKKNNENKTEETSKKHTVHRRHHRRR